MLINRITLRFDNKKKSSDRMLWYNFELNCNKPIKVV